MKIKTFLIIALLLLIGCPKKDLKTIEEIEREEQLKKLLEEEDEIWDDLPESDSGLE
tara:strand:+ start:474 stop:644 length:171 start_codon:yes stop_codon:yes gene_type:complete